MKPLHCHCLQTVVAAAAAAAVAYSAPTQLRVALSPFLFLGIGFVDSSIKGLCTESWESLLITL